ncbi:hypothetical protein DFH29DRAFT_994363 [Suillus ampliporus]|nr:hypothetical protein DFH29DRAFT_994363 [Suillus ampliporus]
MPASGPSNLLISFVMRFIEQGPFTSVVNYKPQVYNSPCKPALLVLVLVLSDGLQVSTVMTGKGTANCHASQTTHIKRPRSPPSPDIPYSSDDDIIRPITPPPILHELCTYSKRAKQRPKPYLRCSPNIIERLYGEDCSACNGSKNGMGIQGDKRRLEHLTPDALAQAIITIQADIEWRHVRALAAALHVDAVNQRSKFIGITVKSEAETYANAISEPLENRNREAH